MPVLVTAVHTIESVDKHEENTVADNDLQVEVDAEGIELNEEPSKPRTGSSSDNSDEAGLETV